MNKIKYIIPIMLVIMLSLPIFAGDSEIVPSNGFYTEPTEFEVLENETFSLIVFNETKFDLVLEFQTEYCIVEYEETMPSQTKMEIAITCTESEEIVILGKSEMIKIPYTTKINVTVEKNITPEPPIIEPEPEVPKTGGGINLLKKGIETYGKDNFFMILNKAKEYSKIAQENNTELKIFYWANKKTVDFTYKVIDDYNQTTYVPYETIQID